MSVTFQLKETKKKFTILKPDGSVYGEWYIDIGNEDMMKSVQYKMNELKEFKNLNADDPDVVEKAVKIQKTIIDKLLNNGFDDLYESANKNMFMMMEVIKKLSQLIDKAFKERLEAYDV